MLNFFLISFFVGFLAIFFFYGPFNDIISSTFNISQINGPLKVTDLLSEKNIEEILFPPKPSSSPPPYQLSIKQKTTPNPAVKFLNFDLAPGAMAVKFRSLVPYPIKIYYEDGNGGLEQGHLTLGQETTTNTYEGHVFFFTDFRDKNKVIGRFQMSEDKVFIAVIDSANPPPTNLLESTNKELKFMDDYYARTGVQWRHYYGPNGPRPPPTLFMWPAHQEGEVHSVTTSHGYWTCRGTAADCQSLEPLHLELEVISLKPRAFIIKNFLNDFEANEIRGLANPQLKHSEVGDVAAGAFESDTRTSRNTWVQRKSSAITETLFRRAADLLQIPERLLNRDQCAEDLQVVHYTNGQKYDSHHDWGVSGFPESRFLTLLLYLNDMASPDAGGETAFPKGAGGRGIKVHAGKGNAMLFYDLLEDGNGDDLSLHAALPVYKGEKWLANFWVWDPKIRH